jgi:4-amino-4-deoxy-L-arabinose transferase-like glycosyltransferase
MEVGTRLTLKGAFVKTRLVAGSNKITVRLAWLIGLIAVGIRLIAITQPYIDNWSWRESDVAAIARNFTENDFRFAYPQIDWAGDAAGFVGTEFPILPFAAALAYKIFGVHEWIGRLETVLFFALSLPFFYLLVRRLFGETTALWSFVFYSFAPLQIAASRAFMPDAPSLSLAIAGIYFFLRWLEVNEWKWLISASISLSVALLIKLPTALAGAPLLYLAWQRFGSSSLRQAKLWLFVVIALFPSMIWYLHAHQIAENFYPYHFFGGGGFQIRNVAWYWKIASRTFFSSLTPIVSILALVGVFVTPVGKYRRAFHWWLAAMVVLNLIVGWGNRHQWYQLPLVPIAATFAGCACNFMAEKFVMRRDLRVALSIALLLALGGWSFAEVRRFYQPDAAALRRLGFELQATTLPDALIIAANDGDPTVFYYAHRKGWHFLENGIYQGNPIDSAQAIANLERLRARGARYFVFYPGTLWWLDYYKEFAKHLAQTSKLVARTPEYAIYELEPASE